ncbi:MAG: indolepyruvate ferredoxin oxidoreductase subunit alpha [Tuberibacillus sp.]
MAYVITSRCVGEKWEACMEVCPVNCILEAANMCYINPDICIDCGACKEVCPSGAIFAEEEVPAEEQDYIRINREYTR